VNGEQDEARKALRERKEEEVRFLRALQARSLVSLRRLRTMSRARKRD
jgi:hypothetical protein